MKAAPVMLRRGTSVGAGAVDGDGRRKDKPEEDPGVDEETEAKGERNVQNRNIVHRRTAVGVDALALDRRLCGAEGEVEEQELEIDYLISFVSQISGRLEERLTVPMNSPTPTRRSLLRRALVVRSPPDSVSTARGERGGEKTGLYSLKEPSDLFWSSNSLGELG